MRGRTEQGSFDSDEVSFDEETGSLEVGGGASLLGTFGGGGISSFGKASSAKGGGAYDFDFGSRPPFDTEDFDLHEGPRVLSKAKAKAKPLTSKTTVTNTANTGGLARTRPLAVGGTSTVTRSSMSSRLIDEKFGLDRFTGRGDAKTPRSEPSTARTTAQDFAAFLEDSEESEATPSPAAKPKPKSTPKPVAGKVGGKITATVVPSDTESEISSTAAPAPLRSSGAPAPGRPVGSLSSLSGRSHSPQAARGRTVTTVERKPQPPAQAARATSHSSVSSFSPSRSPAPRRRSPSRSTSRSPSSPRRRSPPRSRSRSPSSPARSSSPPPRPRSPTTASSKHPSSRRSSPSQGASNSSGLSTPARKQPSLPLSASSSPSRSPSPAPVPQRVSVQSKTCHSRPPSYAAGMEMNPRPAAVEAQPRAGSDAGEWIVVSEQQGSESMAKTPHAVGQALVKTDYDEDDFEQSSLASEVGEDKTAHTAVTVMTTEPPAPEVVTSVPRAGRVVAATVTSSVPKPVVPTKSAAAATVSPSSVSATRLVATKSQSPRTDVDDEDYRPRRPTCHVGVQADVPVDVGCQCDGPPEAERPTSSNPAYPWSFFPSPHLTSGFQQAAASEAFASAASTGFSPFQCAGYPYPFPPPTGGLYPPSTPAGFIMPPWAGGYPPPMPHAWGASMRPGHPCGQPWNAWGAVPSPPTLVPGDRQSKDLSAPNAFSHAAAGKGTAASPDALGALDESFREQIDLLRQAAARHRELLERVRGPSEIARSAPLDGVPESTVAPGASSWSQVTPSFHS